LGAFHKDIDTTLQAFHKDSIDTKLQAFHKDTKMQAFHKASINTYTDQVTTYKNELTQENEKWVQLKNNISALTDFFIEQYKNETRYSLGLDENISKTTHSKFATYVQDNLVESMNDSKYTRNNMFDTGHNIRFDKQRIILRGIDTHTVKKAIWDEYRWVNQEHLYLFLTKLDGALKGSRFSKTSSTEKEFESVVRWVDYDAKLFTFLSHTDFAWSYCMGAISKMFSSAFYSKNRNIGQEQNYLVFNMNFVTAFEFVISTVNSSTALAQFMVFTLYNQPVRKRTKYEIGDIILQQNEQCVKIMETLFLDLESKKQLCFISPSVLRFMKTHLKRSL